MIELSNLKSSTSFKSRRYNMFVDEHYNDLAEHDKMLTESFCKLATAAGVEVWRVSTPTPTVSVNKKRYTVSMLILTMDSPCELHRIKAADITLVYALKQNIDKKFELHYYPVNTDDYI